MFSRTFFTEQCEMLDFPYGLKVFWQIRLEMLIFPTFYAPFETYGFNGLGEDFLPSANLIKIF